MEQTEQKHTPELPVSIKPQLGGSDLILDAKGNGQFTAYRPHAPFYAKAINSHAQLVAALETLLHYAEASRDCLKQTHLNMLLGEKSAPIEQAKALLAALSAATKEDNK